MTRMLSRVLLVVLPCAALFAQSTKTLPAGESIVVTGQQGPQGKQGIQGPTGAAGKDGAQGLPGRDGVTPSCALGNVTGPVKVTLSGANNCTFNFDTSALTVVSPTPPAGSSSSTSGSTAGSSSAGTAALGTFYFIRPDGGTRYDPVNLQQGQCDGKADAAYPGVGTNQHCAFNDVRWMNWANQWGMNQWLMVGGDTLVIRGCSANQYQVSPDNPHCRIGWDQPNGFNQTSNVWYGGTSASLPPPPAGTAARHTRILGGCAYDGNCNQVKGSPYTNNNLTQLFAGFAAPTLLNLGGTSFVDIEGLELTTHNGKCARFGTTNPLPACNRGADYPLSDQADQALATDNTTANILLQDVYIHGFSSSGISGPIGGAFTLTRVNISFNAFAAWNFDDGNSTPDAAGSSITQSYVTMVGNGCQEEYPIVHTPFPAKGCWDTNNGGFGDAWSGQNTMLDSFTCDHCNISFNTKDAAIGPHTAILNLSLTNSVFAGNMGQQGKWGLQPNGTALIQNNFIVGDCNRMSAAMAGAAQNFNASTGLTGSGLTGFCRAAGDVFSYAAQPNSVTQFLNNTVVAESATILDLHCSTAGACATATFASTNNIFLGYTNLSYPSSSGEAPGLYFFSDSSNSVSGSHNVEFGIRNGDTCGQNGNLCGDPPLAGEPAQGSLPPEAPLDSFAFHPTSASPAIRAGAMYGGAPATDFYGNPQSSPITIGAAAQ